MGAGRWINRDGAALFAILLALGLPFLPTPGDGRTRMEIAFNAGVADQPQVISTRTLRSICSLTAATLEFENPETGGYTRIRCG